MEGSGGGFMRQLACDGPPGEWGSAWRAPSSLAPRARPTPEARAKENAQVRTQSWGAWAASFLGAPEEETMEGADADGIGGGEEEWRDVLVERVECEVPVRVWPANTAFKAAEVVFDV
jgi:RAB6A-GEF complex partner protein 2